MSITEIVTVCGAISALYGVFKIYTEIKKPFEDMKKQVESNAKDITELKNKVKDNDNADRIILKALMVILSGGDTQEAIKEINDYLINR